MKQYIVLTGSKRSGTSAMMKALRECGLPIAGFKYPWVITNKALNMNYFGGGFTPTDPNKAIHNPRGYWEVYPETLEGIKHDSEVDGLVIKIVANGLIRSDKNKIDKVIVMVRNPLKILDSRFILEKIERTPLNYKLHGYTILDNYMAIFLWLRQNLKEMKLVIYEELIKGPYHVLEDMCKWIGRGEAKWGVEVVDSQLNRVKGDLDMDNAVKEEMTAFYDLCVKRDFGKIYSYDVKGLANKITKVYEETAKESNKVLV